MSPYSGIMIIASGIALIFMAMYRDLMDESFTSKYNERVTYGLRVGGILIVLAGATTGFLELFG